MNHRINRSLLIEKIDGKIVIFDSLRSVFFNFNETGSYIIDKIKKGFGQKEIIDGLVKRYGIERRTAENDFNDFLNQIQKKKLVSASRRKR